MASKGINWTAILADFVKRHPKTSATIAFNLGVFAAQAAKGGRSLGNGVTDLPAKLIELVPSMKEISTYVPMIGGKPPAKRKTRRAPARKTVRTTARKTVKRARRKAAG